MGRQLLYSLMFFICWTGTKAQTRDCMTLDDPSVCAYNAAVNSAACDDPWFRLQCLSACDACATFTTCQNQPDLCNSFPGWSGPLFSGSGLCTSPPSHPQGVKNRIAAQMLCPVSCGTTSGNCESLSQIRMTQPLPICADSVGTAFGDCDDTYRIFCPGRCPPLVSLEPTTVAPGSETTAIPAGDAIDALITDPEMKAKFHLIRDELCDKSHGGVMARFRKMRSTLLEHTGLREKDLPTANQIAQKARNAESLGDNNDLRKHVEDMICDGETDSFFTLINALLSDKPWWKLAMAMPPNL